MQLALHNQTEPIWYFIFGAKQKSSLSAQYALEHHLQHLVNPNETTLKEHQRTALIIEASAQLFHKVEAWKLQLTVIFLKGELSDEQSKIKREYESIGRGITINQINYISFRKQLYPKIILLYGPDVVQNKKISQKYLHYTGYTIIDKPYTANQIVHKFPKNQNYVFLAVQPQLSEVNILQTYFNIKIVHIKHLRTELSGHQTFFDHQAIVVPQLQQKPYFYSVDGSTSLDQLLVKVGQKLAPQLIYVNVQQGQEREKVRHHAQQSGSLLLSISQIQSVYKRKPGKQKADGQRLDLLVNIVFRSLTRNTIYLTDFPSRPEDLSLLQKRTRPFKLFADCINPQKYQPSPTVNSTIYFLESQRRKSIEPDFPFGRQITSSIKYLIISGPACVGKTSAAKYIASQLGYKHIQYDSYLASVKEKLIAPEDGEQLPFHKVIKHFGQLIATSDNSPLLIDGLNIEWKDLDSWIKANGPPTVLNLKVDEKELIRRTRKKNEADLAAEVTEEESAKIKEAIAKNSDWADQLGTRSPQTTIYQIDFSQQLILAQKLLEEVLRPKVFLVQQNHTTVFQNISIRYNLGFFDLHRHSLKQVSDLVRKGSFRYVVLGNYTQKNEQLICQDFYWIQKFIGIIRYLAVWNAESTEINDEKLHLEAPPKPEKPKVSENQEGQAPPPPEEQTEVKKKAINIYDHEWTKPGNQKNLSQWFFSLKKHISKGQTSSKDLYNSFKEVIKNVSENKAVCIYHKVDA